MSDLSKYCVHIGERSRKRQFPHSNYVVCVQSCDGSKGGYIIRFPHFLFCNWQSTYVFDLYPQSLISCESL